MRQRANACLRQKAGIAKNFPLGSELVNYLLWTAYQQVSVRRAAGFKLGAPARSPAAFPANATENLVMHRVKFIACLLRVIGYVAMLIDAYLRFRCVVAPFCERLSV